MTLTMKRHQKDPNFVFPSGSDKKTREVYNGCIYISYKTYTILLRFDPSKYELNGGGCGFGVDPKLCSPR